MTRAWWLAILVGIFLGSGVLVVLAWVVGALAPATQDDGVRIVHGRPQDERMADDHEA